ncbi:hypothetical protein [Candidatus Cyanaurora vandensis]|uniref:hypothetical protein n=1 Tax=Candidatus Cyanaurora vandensis TaxID=2714958 RepID=UPI0025809ABE|nr:hypothetical protein [Candidatus Cyanaurora vandensis]
MLRDNITKSNLVAALQDLANRLGWAKDKAKAKLVGKDKDLANREQRWARLS